MTLWQAIRVELARLGADKAVLLTVFGGVLFYSFLYPTPYLRQEVSQVPLVLVDQDATQASRRLAFMADASPRVGLAGQAATLAEAQDWLDGERAFGILLIPDGFHRDLLLGRPVTVGIAANNGYFLIYGALAEGLVGASTTLGAEIKVSRLSATGRPLAAATERHSPFLLQARPLFNPGQGYLGYVIPAVFLLILHQTLLIGAGLLSVPGGREGGLTARVGILTLVYLGLGLYYFGWSFERYQIPRQGRPQELLLFLLPFFIATALLGCLLGRLARRRERVTLLVLLSSLPLVFVAGFIWPVEALPPWLDALAQLVPSTQGIKGMLRLNQMGADFAQVLPYWGGLWAQAAVLGGWHWALGWRERRRIAD
ncbi:ABC transporter permease [Zobellella iuensis]|uniref:ABC transporter permease n=1 Tax=Zobellella iuensis TaxID=2803811 RepID=A0ABS1QWD4_9GAMM|nr:ABC transporter permease [Zobellella iuensis]MBL1379200.1 ABC transporter permease [Zobellella iuensis]